MIKDWDVVVNILLQCAQDVITTIHLAPTHNPPAMPKLGGTLGIFPGLRALEFLRQFVVLQHCKEKTVKQVDDLIDRFELTLVQEQWRRWAQASFAISMTQTTAQLAAAWGVWMETVMRASLPASSVCYQIFITSTYMYSTVV